VLAEIEKQGWSSATAVSLIVRDGIVELWGTILDERVRDALCVATENVPEVKQIKDHLVWVDPVSGMTFDARGSVTRWR
jgi:BON domain